MRQLAAYRALLRAELGIAPSQPLESMVAAAVGSLGA
jgi:hypothetical protein